MKLSHAKVLTVHSKPRELIYGALLANPGQDWSVRELAATLPGVSVEAVTATVHMLMGERLMEQVPHKRRLTLRLTDEGHSTIEEITQGWAIARGDVEDKP